MSERTDSPRTWRLRQWQPEPVATVLLGLVLCIWLGVANLNPLPQLKPVPSAPTQNSIQP